MEWSTRVAKIIAKDSIGRGLVIVTDTGGWMRVGNLHDDRMYISGAWKTMRIGNGYYVTMVDALEAAMRGELLGSHHTELLELAVNIDVHAGDGPKIAAFVTTQPWIHIDGISFPPDDVLVYVEDVYGHFRKN